MARRIALILAGLVGIYLAFLVWQASAFIAADNPVALPLGLALIGLALLGAGLVIRELRFGAAVQSMCSNVDFTHAPQPGARLSDVEIAEWLLKLQEQIANDEEDFSLWYHVSCAYEMAHDRPAARRALRHALKLFESGK